MTHPCSIHTGDISYISQTNSLAFCTLWVGQIKLLSAWLVDGVQWPLKTPPTLNLSRNQPKYLKTELCMAFKAAIVFSCWPNLLPTHLSLCRTFISLRCFINSNQKLQPAQYFGEINHFNAHKSQTWEFYYHLQSVHTYKWKFLLIILQKLSDIHLPLGYSTHLFQVHVWSINSIT